MTGRLFVEVGMPLKGVSQVRGSYRALMDDISGQKTIKVVTAVLATGAAWAKTYTPEDTTALINSQRKNVLEMNGVVVGRVWFAQNYAVWLETKDNWTPRKKKEAKPHFLKSGFEDPEPQSEIQNIIRNGYKL